VVIALGHERHKGGCRVRFACGERVIHGNLIGQLATEAVNQSRAYTAARTRRQARASLPRRRGARAWPRFRP